MTTLEGNMTLSSADGLQSATVEIVGAVPITQLFTAADRRPPVITVPQLGVTSWRVANSPPASVLRADLDLLSFSALDARHVRIVAIAGQPFPVPASGYTHEYVVAAVGNAWTGSALPTTGVIRYVGSVFGFARASGTAYDTTATIDANVDFGSKRITGTIADYRFYDRISGVAAAAPPGTAGVIISFTAPIFSDSFSDQLSSSGSFIGRVQGKFAGPAAEEIGAAYHAAGADFNFVGAFVAKR